MWNNLIFSLNATMPIFIVMAVGYLLKRIGFIDGPATKAMTKLAFRIFLPALLFLDVAKQDFVSIWDTPFVLFCCIATFLSIGIAWFLSKTDPDRHERGEFIQAAYRSGAATLGIAFMTNIYDDVAMVALMILASVPIYNVAAVIVLSLTSPEEQGDGRALVKSTLKNLVTNPIILGIAAGLAWSLLKLPMPVILQKSVNYLGNVATPLTLIALGASFEFSDVREKLGPLTAVVFSKLILFCLLFLPVAVLMGFRDEKLVAALIMLGSATTSSCFIMAKAMGHAGKISSAAVMTTTFLSAFTLTGWLFLLKTLGYI